MSYNVRDFGAVGDGMVCDQKALQTAMDRASEDGGGTVVVPGGMYKSGMLRLRSNITLHLESGARIEADDNQSLYPVLGPTPFGNLPGHIQALLYAAEVENVSITGQGTIDGNGNSELWGEMSKDATFRPALVFFDSCRNVTFTNVSLFYSQYWTLHLKHCTDVVLSGLRITSHPRRINADGIDPDGCRNVCISDCIVDTGDDSLVFKSTEGEPCENITVSNCILRSSCQAIKFGTESKGPIRNITISNCIIRDSERALTMFLKDNGPYENIILSNIIAEARNELPFMIDIAPRDPETSNPQSIRSVFFDTIQFTGPGRMLIEGTPENRIENLSIKNLRWNITGEKLDLSSHIKTAGTARAASDPEAENYLANPFHLIAVHVTGFSLQNVQIIDTRASDEADRGMFYLKRVDTGTIENVSLSAMPSNMPEKEIHECRKLQMK
ncbi:MAG: hypothetical protein GF401_16880 [Chitinivibrionales bacterium]|nr:hypothetical protein [Chitinivibrionales bacterium]